MSTASVPCNDTSSDVFFVGHCFIDRPHCLSGLQQVFGEPFHHLLLQQEFVPDVGGILDKRGQALSIKAGLHQPSTRLRFRQRAINLSNGQNAPTRKPFYSQLRRREMVKLSVKNFITTLSTFRGAHLSGNRYHTSTCSP